MQIHHHHRDHSRQQARENRSRTFRADRHVLTFETLRPYVFYCRCVVRCSRNASLQLFLVLRPHIDAFLRAVCRTNEKENLSRLLFISHRNAQKYLISPRSPVRFGQDLDDRAHLLVFAACSSSSSCHDHRRQHRFHSRHRRNCGGANRKGFFRVRNVMFCAFQGRAGVCILVTGNSRKADR